MELFDTHTHFECDAAEIAAQLQRARAAGVTRLMAVGGSVELNATARQSASYCARLAHCPNGDTPDVYLALGYDRDQAGRGELPDIDYTGVTAVGEIGLDYFYAGASRAAQRELFARQLELARTVCSRGANPTGDGANPTGLPVVIHTREADDDTLGLLREIPSRGIIHCFTGSRAFCGKLLDLGFYVSISGIVTFRKADDVRDVARHIPDDRLLIETDAPYLAPVPMRGKPNESAFLVHTAHYLADLRHVDVETLAARTTSNARAVLGA